ncbi:hypothetical protein I7I48_09190 [Histoplasma ohiense]|nr:hypothetical protein I7I48_09190 [Histoplasma ohiense (nom. inval.)]
MVTFPVDDSKSTSRLLLGARRWIYSSKQPLVPWICITISAFVLRWLSFTKSGSPWLSSQRRVLSFRGTAFGAVEAWPNADIGTVGSFLVCLKRLFKSKIRRASSPLSQDLANNWRYHLQRRHVVFH